MSIFITSAFDSGCIKVVKTTSTSVELRMPPDSREFDSRGAVWFYFRASGLPVNDASKKVEFNILNAGDIGSSNCWDGYMVCGSYDRKNWFRVSDTSFHSKILTWRHTATSPTCFYAYFPPYTREKQLDLISELLVERPDCCSSTTLGTSIDGDTVDVLCIGNPPPLLTVQDHDLKNSTTTVSSLSSPKGRTDRPRSALLGADSASTSLPTAPPRAHRNAGKKAVEEKKAHSTASTGQDASKGEARDTFDTDNTSQRRKPPIRSVASMRRGSIEKAYLDRQLQTLRQQLIREMHLRSGTAKMIEVLQLNDDGDTSARKRTRKIAKLEGELASFNARITGIRLELRNLCTDWWFGHSLVDFCRSTGRPLPLVVESCVNAIKHVGLEEEGIFRVPGETDEVKALREAFERADDPLADSEPEELKSKMHAIASCLKLYLRELEDPLLTHEHFDMWIAIGADKESSDESKILKCQSIVKSMPQAHVDTIKFLLPLLSRIADKNAKNKMTPTNLATVFGPTFLRSDDSGMSEMDSMAKMLRDTGPANSVTEFLITNYVAILFPVGQSPSDASSEHKDSSTRRASEPLSIKAVPSAPKAWVEGQYLDLTLSRSEAENILLHVAVEGCFVIRSSSNVGSGQNSNAGAGADGMSYTITFFAEGAVNHYRITLAAGKLLVNKKPFDSLQQIVLAFQTMPLFGGVTLRYPVTRQTPLVIAEAIASGATREEAIASVGEVWDMNTLHAGAAAAMPKATVWVIGRQQPGAPQTSYFIEGLLRRLLDRDDPMARSLLHRANFFVVPMLNPDGVRRGNARANAAGIDLQKEWNEPSSDTSPEVWWCKQAMLAAPPDVCLDSLADQDLPFVFPSTASVKVPSVTDRQESLFAKFCNTLRAANPEFQTERGKHTSAQGAADLNVLSPWAAEQYSCLAITLMQPFKDNNRLPQPKHGWSTSRAEKLGASALDALHGVINDMLAHPADPDVDTSGVSIATVSDEDV
eukprot:m.210457 g.210457  ORF g.210457 m.210457 type:complete len:988 (-) comp19009_c0_seq1:87-3050(-)